MNTFFFFFFYQGDFKIIIRNAGSNNIMCIMLTRKWTCYSWVDFCVFLDRETVGLPDLCWIWILPEHWFTQPAVRWLPSCVSTPNMASKAHTFNCIFSCHSYWGFFLFLPIQIFSETVYKLLQHQCWAGGGGCHTDQWVLRCLWHPLKQNCVPQWLHWPLACLGGHSGHLSWPTCDFHQRWTKMMHNEFLC